MNYEIRKAQIRTKVKQPFSVLYLSDFHFNGWSHSVAAWMLAQIDALSPDIILLGGDYVDTPKVLKILEFFFKGISAHTHCFAIAGNHDYFFGINKVKKLLTDYGITWLENYTAIVASGAVRIRIDGNRCGDPTTAASSDFAILCAHNPKILNGDLSGYQLALAGHLHGSQVVLWQNKKGLFPGRFFYKWNILHQKINDCACYISKGLGDTLPVRFNCKKDAIFVQVLPAKSYTP